ncbi:MAG: kynureninase [Rhodospirillales bacterium 69-11]|nr:kynureninase [Rhodospirillales bacterium]OJW24894.1 MAG: kynureninase [Rhodospirillales bacterium 69-11]
MIDRATLAALDAADPLAGFRDRFTLPEGVIYLDGNSLGALPRATPARVAEVVAQEWGQSLIRAWNAHGWIDLGVRVGEKIGRLIGAAPGSTVVADSTSINLFKLLAAALTARPGRRTLLTETGNFPTDLYVADGLTRLLAQGHRVRAADNPVAALDGDVAVLMLTHVNYRSGAMHDMASVTRAAHAAGALVLWDLSHSAGAVPLTLAADGADFAVGCGYKFLNGGPGAPAFLSVAPALQADLRLPITGWLGHAAPFDFAPAYRPAPGVAAAVVGTPPVLSLAALEVGVDLMLDAPIAALREKSLRLGDTFLTLMADMPGFVPISPRDETRGSQVAFRHPDGYAIMQALIARGVIGDFRAPDILRFGLAPLYLRYVDVWDTVVTLREVMTTEVWRDARFQHRQAVT